MDFGSKLSSESLSIFGLDLVFFLRQQFVFIKFDGRSKLPATFWLGIPSKTLTSKSLVGWRKDCLAVDNDFQTTKCYQRPTQMAVVRVIPAIHHYRTNFQNSVGNHTKHVCVYNPPVKIFSEFWSRKQCDTTLSRQFASSGALHHQILGFTLLTATRNPKANHRLDVKKPCK